MSLPHHLPLPIAHSVPGTPASLPPACSCPEVFASVLPSVWNAFPPDSPWLIPSPPAGLCSNTAFLWSPACLPYWVMQTALPWLSGSFLSSFTFHFCYRSHHFLTYSIICPFIMVIGYRWTSPHNVNESPWGHASCLFCSLDVKHLNQCLAHSQCSINIFE